MGADPYTLHLEFTVTNGIKEGMNYIFRYRAINIIGAGEWSDQVLLKAASVPSAPPKPTY